MPQGSVLFNVFFKIIVHQRIQFQLEEIQKWTTQWHMQISVKKTAYLLVDHRSTSRNNEINLLFDGQQIIPEMTPNQAFF